MTWEIIAGLIVLVGFLITLAGPFAKLIKTMTQLTISLVSLEKALDELVTKNSESHSRLWQHNDTQDTIINNHEKRITRVELRMDVDNKFKEETQNQ